MDVKKYLFHWDSKDIKSFDDLLNSKYPIDVYEDKDNYYVIGGTSDKYDSTTWVIDKQSGESNPMNLLDFMFEVQDGEEGVKYIEPPYDKLKVGA